MKNSVNDDVRLFARTARHLGPILVSPIAGRAKTYTDQSVDLPFRTHTTNHLMQTERNSGRRYRSVGVHHSHALIPRFRMNSSVHYACGRCVHSNRFPPALFKLQQVRWKKWCNALRHSQQPNTALAGFRARRRFEFAVLDAGIGILRSLRQCSEYAELSVEEDALELSLMGCPPAPKQDMEWASRHIQYAHNHAGHLWLPQSKCFGGR